MINDVINWVKSVDLHTALTIIDAILIIAIFKVFSPLFSLIVLKIFKIKKSKEELKNTAYYKTLKKFFPILRNIYCYNEARFKHRSICYNYENI